MSHDDPHSDEAAQAPAQLATYIAGGHVEKLINIAQAEQVVIQPSLPSLLPSLHQLPSPPGDFTGRAAELAELMVELEQRRASIAVLHGMAGIGKTTLALKLAEQLTPRYPYAQLYIDLKGVSPQPLSPAEVMTRVIHAYHPTAQLPENEVELSGLYQSALHSHPAFLLLDNAANEAQVTPLIPPVSCFLLVTSRRHITLPGQYSRHLDLLLPEDARKLLLAIASRIGEHADALACLCGYLPLALRVAASTLAKRIGLSLGDYLRRLTDTQQRLQMTGVDAPLTLSFELLDPEQQQPWCLLATFPDTFDSQAAAAMWQLEPDPGQDLLDILVEYSLVECNAKTARYYLHDLVRLFADARLGELERATGRKRHAIHYMEILTAAENLYRQGDESITQGLALFDLEWENVQAGQTWAAVCAAKDDTALVMCALYPGQAPLLLGIRQYPRQRLSWLKHALTAVQLWRSRLSHHLFLNTQVDTKIIGTVLGNLGSAYIALGEPRQAIEACEQGLAILRELGDRHGEGCMLGN